MRNIISPQYVTVLCSALQHSTIKRSTDKLLCTKGAFLKGALNPFTTLVVSIKALLFHELGIGHWFFLGHAALG